MTGFGGCAVAIDDGLIDAKCAGIDLGNVSVSSTHLFFECPRPGPFLKAMCSLLRRFLPQVAGVCLCGTSR